MHGIPMYPSLNAHSERTPEYPIHLDLILGSDDQAHPSVPAKDGAVISFLLMPGRDGSLSLTTDLNHPDVSFAADASIAELHAWLWQLFTRSPYEQALDADVPPDWLRRRHETWTDDEWQQAAEWCSDATLWLRRNALGWEPCHTQWQDQAAHGWVPVDADWLDTITQHAPDLARSLAVSCDILDDDADAVAHLLAGIAETIRRYGPAAQVMAPVG